MNTNLSNSSNTYSSQNRAHLPFGKATINQNPYTPEYENPQNRNTQPKSMQVTKPKSFGSPQSPLNSIIIDPTLEKRKSSPNVKELPGSVSNILDNENNSPRKQKEDFIIKTKRTNEYSSGTVTICKSSEDLQKINSKTFQELHRESVLLEAKSDSISRSINKREDQEKSQTVTKILVTANKFLSGAGQASNVISIKKASNVVNRLQETSANKNITPPRQKPSYGEPYRYGKTAQGSRARRIADGKTQNEIDLENDNPVRIKLEYDDNREAILNDKSTTPDQKNNNFNRFGFQRPQKKSLDGSSKNRKLSPDKLRENGIDNRDKNHNLQATLDAYENSNRLVRIQLTRVGPRPIIKAVKNMEENIDPMSDFQMTQRVEEVHEIKTRIEEFAFEKILGQGSYAVVKLARDRRTNQKYAIKTYERFKLYDTQRRKNVRLEISVLKGLDHPNIIKLYYTILNTTQINLVMELGGQQSLHCYLKTKEANKLSEEEARRIFKQLAEGTKYFHDKNIAHRDLKNENILIDNDKNIKIIDFGFSVPVQKDKLLAVFCGTPSYMAPELANRREYDGIYVDIWALGIILYVMLSGKFPFKGENDRELYKKISRCSFERIKDISIEAQALISRMLRFNPHDRLTASQILEDNWIKGEQNSHQEFNNFISEKLLECKNNEKQFRTSGMTPIPQDQQISTEKISN